MTYTIIGRGTTTYVYTLGSAIVSWVSRLQKFVALSTTTTETKYVVAIEACKEMIWLKKFSGEIVFEQKLHIIQ